MCAAARRPDPVSRRVGRPPAVAACVPGLAIALAAWLTMAAAPTALAEDPAPAPTPLVFHTPQYLVWMDGHASPNGPVEDKAYWLYIAPPDEDGTFGVPDGNGGRFWYSGRLIAGPFTGEADACPAMLAEGVTSLTAWAVAAGEESQVVDCTRFLATPTAPAAGPGDPGPGGDGDPATGSALTGDDDVDPEALGIAVALIGLLLFGGGALLVTGGRGGPVMAPGGPSTGPDPDPEPRPQPTAEPPAQPAEPPPDPCADQVADLARASVSGRYLNDLLASCRRYEALLQEQIDVLANLVLPGSVMLDLGFAAGGLSGGLAGPLGRKLIASATFRAAIGESIAKDLAKELGKQALGSAGGTLDAGNLAAEGGKSGIKQTLLEGLEAGLVKSPLLDGIDPNGPVRVFRNTGEYAEFLRDMEAQAHSVAGPIKDGVGALIDLYQGVSSALELNARLDQLRTLRDRIADRRVDLEMQFESVLDAQRFASERLAHCRSINAPGWRP
ncbi:MAG: hypothetical protein AB1627_11535 [Chloroflexota bacterium]